MLKAVELSELGVDPSKQEPTVRETSVAGTFGNAVWLLQGNNVESGRARMDRRWTSLGGTEHEMAAANVHAGDGGQLIPAKRRYHELGNWQTARVDD
jgi:hypothetical protein